MRHNAQVRSTILTLTGAHTQESAAARMHTLLSAFERGIDGAGPLIESPEVGELRRELHATCSAIRDGLNRLSDGTRRLERAATKHTQRSYRSGGAKPAKEMVRVGLDPALWPKA